MRKTIVSAPARIHMGILNPTRVAGRRLYGSIGVGVEIPRTIIEVEQASDVHIAAPYISDYRPVIKKIVGHYRLNGARVNVISTPKPHTGLGSTTQLSLSIATGITRAYGIDAKPVELATILGRGEQSAIGTYVFEFGGFVADGGWGEKTSFPPLLFRYSFPEEWRFLIVVPESRSFDETQERELFGRLPAVDEGLVYEAGYRLLLGIAPALVERDIQSFGANLFRLQEIVGTMFSKAQGGVFQPHSASLIDRLRALGAIGVGQSSWGPAVYAVFDAETGMSVEALLRREILESSSIKQFDANLYGTSKWGEIFFTRADNKGAIVT